MEAGRPLPLGGQRLRALLAAHAEERDPEEDTLYRELQLLDYFLLSEHHTQTLLSDPHHRAVAEELVATFRKPGPAAARFPGIFWPFTGHLADGSRAVAPLTDLAVANCRRHSEPWGLAVALLFRAQARIDRPGGLSLTHDDLPEIGSLAASTGDRWLLASCADCVRRTPSRRGATTTPGRTSRPRCGTRNTSVPSPRCRCCSPASPTCGSAVATPVRPTGWHAAPSRRPNASASETR
ncbi:hypothetical protein AB0939_20120 [Streptomyces sp. NPDC006990]|uniref:hypothetical protein n=1 Tax=Streptomyces sp. NPDC006990 TaxID=3154481 RepID=UPI0034557D2D